MKEYEIVERISCVFLHLVVPVEVLGIRACSLGPRQKAEEAACEAWGLLQQPQLPIHPHG